MTAQQPDPNQPPGRIKDIRVYRNSFIGMILLACVPFMIFASIPVYGWWPAIAMFLVWIGLLVKATRLFMPKPNGVVLLAVLGIVMWTAVVVLARVL